MTNKQIEKEWRRLNFEIFENKPKLIDKPYPPDVVKKRELLLFAQVHLSNISDAKLKKDKCYERFETEMHNKVMEIYYNWDKNE